MAIPILLHFNVFDLFMLLFHNIMSFLAMKDDVLACFILILDRDQAKNTAASRETMPNYNAKKFKANDVIKPQVNVICYSYRWPGM